VGRLKIEGIQDSAWNLRSGILLMSPKFKVRGKKMVKSVSAKKAPAKKAAAKTAAPRRRRVKFTVQAEAKSEIFVAGSFNDWSPTKNPLTSKNGDELYEGSILLPKGIYEYKFIINDTWCVDPECSEWVVNDLGSLNSVLTVS
jgi:5'-AMP-activated protein kinase regulatory beta subunit